MLVPYWLIIVAVVVALGLFVTSWGVAIIIGLVAALLVALVPSNRLRF